MRRHWPLALVALALLAAYLPLACSDLIGSQDDGTIYLLAARHYAPWAAPDPVAAAFAADMPFPPLFPAVLALGGAAHGAVAAHAVTVLCLLLALGAMYAWLLALDAGRAAATLAVTVFALCPGTVELLLNVLSEPLFLALALAACAGLVRRPPPAPRPDAASWSVAALVAAALMTRSVGVTLLPPLAVYLWQRHRRAGVPLLAAALVPQAAWSLGHAPSLGYGGVVRNLAPRVLEHPLQFLAGQAQAMAQGLSADLFLGRPWVLLPLGLVALGAAAVRAGRGHADALFLSCYLAVLLLWPFADEAARLMWVSIPLLLGNLLWAAMQAARRWRTAAPAVMPHLPSACAVALGVAVAPGPLLVAQRWSSPEAQARPELRHVLAWYDADPAAARSLAMLHLEFVHALADFGARMPAGTCSFSITPRFVAYYAGQHSYLPPPPEADAAGFDAYLRRLGCRYFVLIAGTSARGPTPFYPLERLGGRLAILARRTLSIDAGDVPVALLGELQLPAR